VVYRCFAHAKHRGMGWFLCPAAQEASPGTAGTVRDLESIHHYLTLISWLTNEADPRRRKSPPAQGQCFLTPCRSGQGLAWSVQRALRDGPSRDPDALLGKANYEQQEEGGPGSGRGEEEDPEQLSEAPGHTHPQAKHLEETPRTRMAGWQEGCCTQRMHPCHPAAGTRSPVIQLPPHPASVREELLQTSPGYPALLSVIKAS